jgi:hydroxymethylbilane synthase
MKPVVVATRGSALAVGQAEFLVEHLRTCGFEVDWRKLTTSGDQWLSGPLNETRGTGFFTKELEDALSGGAADLLIHSLKDVALARPEGYAVACIPEREDPADWLVARPDLDLPTATIGTSSVRRERMLRAVWPGTTYTWIRGNVPTRVQRVREGLLRDQPLHGTLLAASGLKRLNLDLSDLAVRPLTPEELLPAPGQGALLAETRTDRPDLIEAFARLHHPATQRCVELERRVLAGIGGGCQQPLGALATVTAGGGIRLRAAFAGEEGITRAEAEGVEDRAVLAAVLEQLGWACA